MLVNTEYFRIAAKYHQKYARYDDGVFGSLEYDRYWEEEIKRCKEGIKIGDTWISGYHYFYLNYWQIMKVKKTESGLLERDKELDRQRAVRIESFPDFWDVDYEFFQEIERAEENGQHFMWLKPRGVGASWKGSAMLARNYFLYRKSKGYMMAYQKEYLQKDGLLTKFNDGREFILRSHKVERDRYAIGFAKPSDFKKSFEEMHYRASTKDPDTGDEVGFKSEVIGISVKDDPDKPRGKRGKLIIYEEMGKFPDVDSVWNISRSAVEEQDAVYGTMLGFGTGGTQNADFQSFEKMFYNASAFNIRVFDNIYDEGMHGTKCAFFTPAYKTIQFKDQDGNSDIAKGKRHIKKLRDEASESPDPNTLLQCKAEHPECPQEAILSTAYRILPSTLAKEHGAYIQAKGLFNIGVPGIIERIGDNLKFFPGKNEHPPITSFPFNFSKDDLHGSIVIYQMPMRDKDGRIPEGLYIAGHDPYAQDAGGESIGATYIYMNPNNIYPPGDKVVATFFGRPKTQDDYNKIMFDLIDFYNAMLGFENDQGDVVGYAKRFKKLERLFPEFECGWDVSIKTKEGGRRSYGMNIGSGRENKRKLQGDKYLNDWLITGRGKLEDGRQTLNLHTFHCLFTMKQIELYNIDGNFDGIAALRVLMYFRKELDYKGLEIKRTQVYRPGSIFTTKLFQGK
jgi:hypothetical protein